MERKTEKGIFAKPETCDHPDFNPESYLGTPTYDFYCTVCGRVFSETQMRYLRGLAAQDRNLSRTATA